MVSLKNVKIREAFNILQFCTGWLDDLYLMTIKGFKYEATEFFDVLKILLSPSYYPA